MGDEDGRRRSISAGSCNGTKHLRDHEAVRPPEGSGKPMSKYDTGIEQRGDDPGNMARVFRMVRSLLIPIGMAILFIS
jgi:hypothetical protein